MAYLLSTSHISSIDNIFRSLDRMSGRINEMTKVFDKTLIEIADIVHPSFIHDTDSHPSSTMEYENWITLNEQKLIDKFGANFRMRFRLYGEYKYGDEWKLRLLRVLKQIDLGGKESDSQRATGHLRFGNLLHIL